MVRSPVLVLLAVAAALGGCGGAPESDPEAVIRGWNRAVNAGDFDRAGAFFAPNAVVEQVEEMRLRGPADAARFSASLPCRAEVTRVVVERRSSLASFRLRDGQAPCSGAADVRFVVRDDKLTEWRQLPPPPPGRGLEVLTPDRSKVPRPSTA